MTETYTVRRYSPELKNQVIDLQAHLWSPRPELNRAYFEWKYERNPYLADPLIFVAMHEDTVVGMRGFFGVQWEAGVPVQRFTSLYADDMVVAPEHRRHGLTTRIMSWALADLASRGYDYVFNLSAGTVTLHSSLKMGWRTAGGMRPMLWHSTRSRLLRRLARMAESLPVFYGFVKPLATIGGNDFAPGNRKIVAYGLSIQETPRCHEMAQLLSRIDTANQGHIRHVRDAEYLKWRFANPLSRYHFIYSDNRQLDGYLVLHEYASEMANHEVVNVVDWEAADPAVLERLLRGAIAIASRRPIVIWSATLSQDAIALLLRHGFRAEASSKPNVLSPPQLLIRKLRRDLVGGHWTLAGLPLLDIANWDLRMLYSMVG